MVFAPSSTSNTVQSLVKKKNPEKVKQWLPVDIYIGGAEHAVLHLLYSRFWHKVLYDIGVVPTKEPFQQLFNQGMILGENNEKMSKSKFNTVNPDMLVEKYGADTFRMYEMFLGPVEQSKPWDTKGIEGVHRFLKKLWRLFYDELKGKQWVDEKATAAGLKVLHKTIKKIEEDTERYSFNTAVSTFMICVNELSDLKCHKKEILEQVLIMLTPYAPHICEELWSLLGNTGSILDASFPVFNAGYVAESSKEYPVSINGRVRTNISMGVDVDAEEAQAIVLQNEVVQKWLEGKELKKFIFVKGKMINVVI